jgi:hypothetical protein
MFTTGNAHHGLRSGILRLLAAEEIGFESNLASALPAT